MIMSMRTFIFSLVLLHCSTLWSAPSAYIPVGPGKAKKTVLAFTDIETKTTDSVLKASAKSISDSINKDLLFMDQYTFLAAAAFKDDHGVKPDSFDLSKWKSSGADFLIRSSLTKDGTKLEYEIYLYQPSTAKVLLAKKLIAKSNEVETLAHEAANEIVTTLTGLPGIFLTKIAMSCDITGKKEIYIMDFDGTNTKQITKHKSTAMSPAWSPDGSKLAYSVYNRHSKNVKNLDLFEYNFKTNKLSLLSNRTGINSGAHYHPTKNLITLTMSFLGNPEVFSLSLDSKDASRLTSSFGFDVDPVWSPNGSEIAFVSSRSGKPMIYKMSSNGSSVKRLTYAGNYNATPHWSPQAKKITFAGWLDGRFDIFLMNSDGTKIERLTKQQGNNEDPYFSPDGNFIIFSSNRAGTKNIYAMNVDGTYVKRLSYGLGNCVSPKWSNPPKN